MALEAEEGAAPAPVTALKRGATNFSPRTRKKKAHRAFRLNMYDNLKSMAIAATVVASSPIVRDAATQMSGTFAERFKNILE